LPIVLSTSAAHNAVFRAVHTRCCERNLVADLRGALKASARDK